MASMVIGELGEDPRSGDCFVFVGRDKRRLKILVWDEGGYSLSGGLGFKPEGMQHVSLNFLREPRQLAVMTYGHGGSPW